MKKYLAIFLFSILIHAAPAPVVGTMIDRIEAFVNTSLIFHSDILKFRKIIELRRQLDPLFSGTVVASKGSSSTDSEIVDFLIDETLIAQQFLVNDQEVEQEVNLIQANNKVDRPGLRAALKEQGFDFEDYFELIRASTAKRNLLDRDIRIKVTISDDDVRNYFFNNYLNRTAADISYHIRMITLHTGNFKNAKAALETANQSLDRIKAGESFEEVAKVVSDDATAPQGGDLGIMTESQMSPVIREQIKKLKIGEISSVIGSPGPILLILKLIDANASNNEQYLKMKDEIHGQMVTGEYQHQIRLWLERQRNNTFVHRAGETSIPDAIPANL